MKLTHATLLQTMTRWGLLASLVGGLAVPAFGQDDEDGPPAGEDGPERIRPMPIGPGGLPMPGRLGGPEGGPAEGPAATPTPPGPKASPESDAKGEPTASPTGSVNTKKVPCVEPTSKVTMDFADAPLMDVVKYMAEITCRNFILSKELSGNVTIISHQQVTVAEAYEAFLSALEVAGYTTVTVGKNTKVVETGKAANAPLRVYEGDEIPGTDNFVTQIITLDNVSVSDVSTIVKELSGSSARVIAYAPTNTLIVTDAAFNIRRVYRIVKQLDVAAPRSKIEIVPLKWATAADVEKILEDVYGVTATSTTSSSSSSTASSRTRRRRDEAEAATSASSTNVGKEGAFIEKIISDERTNSLILMANDEALAKVKELIAQIDVDVDPSKHAQIHVIYLEHAKAEDVASVLSNLSSSSGRSSSSGSSSSRSGTGSSRSGSQRGRGSGTTGSGPGSGSAKPGLPGGAEGGSSTGVTAALDSDVRIAADDNTNSLVLVAGPEEYRILKSVIDKLDIPRRQVFVEAVVVEVGSEDEFNLGLGLHGGLPNDDGSVMFGSMQLGANSVALDLSSLLSGLAMGVIGETIEVPYLDTSTLTTSSLEVPSFGIALNALASNSAVDIVSNPNLLVVDNEEATINVGRNVPFPVSAGRDNNNNPIVSYQREDVGITLTVTPQINESNYVTLELSLEVAEVEEDASASFGLDAATAGFITSTRQTENVVVVRDNQTIVIGGLIGTTGTEVETKIPLLGDLPLLGVLFRGKRETERKTNLLIFLTPHVINEPADLEEVYRVKAAQREEFLRRFYGRSREAQEEELKALLFGSMNFVDEPSQYRQKKAPADTGTGTIDTGAGKVEQIPEPAAPTTPAQPEPTEYPDLMESED
ncbi:MAG: type II secretion system secretin GspD [Myxococcota bacterium]